MSKLNRFAFALAEVAVRIAVFEPRFNVILLALLHESCVLAVPKYYPFVVGRYASDDEYFRLMGYVDAEDQGERREGDPPKLETTDAFGQRLRGFMLFYAAYTQVEHATHPHGMEAAWSWISRLLNRIPPNRHSGAFYTLVPIRPRSRGERRSLRTFPGASLRPSLAFNPRPRHLSTPTNAFQLDPDIRLYGTTLSDGVGEFPEARRVSHVRDVRLAVWQDLGRRRPEFPAGVGGEERGRPGRPARGVEDADVPQRADVFEAAGGEGDAEHGHVAEHDPAMNETNARTEPRHYHTVLRGHALPTRLASYLILE